MQSNKHITPNDRRMQTIQLYAIALIRSWQTQVRGAGIMAPQNLEDSAPPPLESEPERLLTVTGS